MSDKKVDCILEECKKLEDFINNNLLTEFSRLHNIDPVFCKFKVKQEVVAKRALFFNTKKKYVLYIINDKGKEVDDYFFRGIVNRRSDYPSYTKDCIKKLLDMILREEKLKFFNINDFVEKTRKEIINMLLSGDKRVAKPVTYSQGVEEYIRVPPQIEGMLLWNELEYNYFVVGTKGYQFKIKGIDIYNCPSRISKNAHKLTDKNNNIVVPYEEGRLPEYYILDVEKSIKFCWDDRVNEILEPLLEINRKGSDKSKKRPSQITW